MTATATGQSEFGRLLAGGCYVLRDARRLTGVPEAVSRRFVRHYKGELGLWGGGRQRLGERYYVTFRDLMELRVINAFRIVGLQWPVIVRTAGYGRVRFGTDYPFSDRRFQTDGRDVFNEGVDGLEPGVPVPAVPPRKVYEQGAVWLEEVSGNRQLAFDEVVDPSLFEPMEYLDDVPVRWYPAEDWGESGIGRSVVVDPKRSFGAPVVADGYVPTQTLYWNFVAEGKNPELVARSYEISVDAVLCAVAFEEAAARR